MIHVNLWVRLGVVCLWKNSQHIASFSSELLWWECTGTGLLKQCINKLLYNTRCIISNGCQLVVLVLSMEIVPVSFYQIDVTYWCVMLWSLYCPRYVRMDNIWRFQRRLSIIKQANWLYWLYFIQWPKAKSMQGMCPVGLPNPFCLIYATTDTHHSKSKARIFKTYFTFSHHLSMVGLSAFLLAVHRLCGFVEGRLSHFLPHWLKTGWQNVISQGKTPWNTPPWLGGQTVSYHDWLRHIITY